RNVFSHNTITGDVGIWLHGVDQTQTGDTNTISYNTVNATSNGFYCSYTNRLTLENNKVTGGGNGLYMNYCDSGITRNNAISSAAIGLKHENSKGPRFYHNSILSSGDHGVYVNYDLPQWTGNEWKNNIIASYSSSSNSMFIEGASGSNTWDYNLHYTSSTS